MSEQPPAESGQSELRDALQKNSRRKRGIIIGVVVAAVAVVALVVTLLVVNNAGGKGDAEAAAVNGEDRLKVKIAIAEDANWYDTVTEVAAEKGLDVEWLNVDDWVLPNTELQAGSVDANAFQHILYLSAFNVESDAGITPVFSTIITQWGIFSASHGDLGELPDGAVIAIPDDPSNGARALYILEAAGLLDIDDAAGEFPTVSDIVDNPKNLELKEIKALTIPQAYDDPQVTAVVVGTSYFDPSQGITGDDALYLDDPLAPSNLPYINVVAVNADDVDNPAWKILEEAYADPRVEEAIDKEFGGSLVRVDLPVEELRASLADLEEIARQSAG